MVGVRARTRTRRAMRLLTRFWSASTLANKFTVQYMSFSYALSYTVLDYSIFRQSNPMIVPSTLQRTDAWVDIGIRLTVVAGGQLAGNASVNLALYFRRPLVLQTVEYLCGKVNLYEH
jgi:hypothetical protein